MRSYALTHQPIEHTHHLVWAGGHWDGFAPCAHFGNPQGVMPENVGSNIVCCADRQNRQAARIIVAELVQVNRRIAHDRVELH